MKKILLILLGLTALAAQAKAEIRLPAILGDHMVLQQDGPALWGWAEAGKTITASLAGQKASATVGTDGKWKLAFPAIKAGGPYNLVLSGDGSVTISDVLVGDVWVGSGQSNMEFLLKNSKEADAEIAKADYPQIRLFTVDHASTGVPQEDVKGSWKVCSPSTAGDFSAVAYYYGKGLHQSLKIPMGLVADSWGGTPAEDWIPRSAMDKDDDLAKLAKAWDSGPSSSAWKEGLPYQFQISDLRFIPKDKKAKPALVALQPGDKGLGGTWSCYINPGSTGAFTAKGKGPKGGVAYSLDGTMKGGCWITLQTSLGTLDLSPYESVEFYVRGNSKYRLKLGQASIADYDFYSTDAFEAPSTWTLMSYPIASLKQGGWGAAKPFTPEAIQSLVINPEVPYNPEVASVAYNGMIAPLTPFKIKGVLWYQGEANWGRSSQYGKTLSALITSWREAWGIPFPFLIVQLPNFQAVQGAPSESSWAEIREGQLQTAQTLPKTGVVTTIDLGEADNIHPKNKKDVGARLTKLGLTLAYGKAPSYFSPVFDKGEVKGKTMVLHFKNVGGGLALKPGETGDLKGFALSGTTRGFYWAKAKITGPDTVEVSAPEVDDPAEARYAWADNPVCNLASKEGFPASPFRFSAKPMKIIADEIPPPP